MVPRFYHSTVDQINTVNTMSIDLDAVARAISATREGLAASGFAIDCAADDRRLSFAVRALDNACEECLVPKPVFESILARELGDAGIAFEALHISYPVEAGDELE